MAIGVVIPHETHVSVIRNEFKGLASYKAAVGGHIEIVNIGEPSLTLIFDEEGKVRELPVNMRATCLWWMYSPDVRGHDFLVGDVVVVGSDREQEPTDLPTHLLDRFTLPLVHLMEALTSAAPNAWIDAYERYPDFYQASLAALALLQAEPRVLNVRVRPID